MNLDFFSKPAGYLSLFAAFVALCAAALWWQHSRRLPVLAPAAERVAAALPKVFTREGARFVPPNPPALPPLDKSRPAEKPAVPPVPPPLPLRLYAGTDVTSIHAGPDLFVGRMIPCETVVALESSRQATPIIALVTEDVWVDGACLVPAGTEVQGRFTLDRSRSRLAADGTWTLMPPRGAAKREPTSLQATALERDIDPASGLAGPNEGIAGLPGHVLRSDNAAELKLFASTFISTATMALQESRATSGLLGEIALPAVTARNAALAGTSAVLRDYAQQLRDAIAKDGLYVRVPAGTHFYLHVKAAPQIQP